MVRGGVGRTILLAPMILNGSLYYNKACHHRTQQSPMSQPSTLSSARQGPASLFSPSFCPPPPPCHLPESTCLPWVGEASHADSPARGDGQPAHRHQTAWAFPRAAGTALGAYSPHPLHTSAMALVTLMNAVLHTSSPVGCVPQGGGPVLSPTLG